MKILSLEISNFLTIGHAELKLSDKGLCLVQGENCDDPSADSNGAGKSSLPDALAWCFFGTTARGVTGDAVINRAAKKNTRVAAHIIDDDDEYLIVRHRKHKEGKNGLQVFKRADKPELAPTDITKGTDKLTQQLVERIIGCSADVFNAAVYAGQEKMPDLPGMTDKQLKLLVEEAAGIDRLQRAYEVARLKSIEARRAHDDAVEHRGRIIAEIERREGELGDLKTREKSWNEGRVARVRNIAKECKELKVEVDAIKSAIAEADEEGLRAKLAALDEKLAGRKAEEDGQEQLQKVLRDAERDVVKKRSELDHALRQVKLQKDRLEDIDKQVGSPCGECGKPYCEDDMAAAREIAQNNLRERVSLATKAKTEHADAVRRAESASERLSAFIATMTDVSEVLASQKRLRDELAAIESEKRDLERLSRDLKVKVKQANEIKVEENPYTEFVATVEKALEASREKLSEAADAILEAELTSQVAEDAVQVFGPAGVRAHILDTVTPYLNDRTAHYLGSLSDGLMSAVWSTLDTTAKGELREKFNIAVSHATGATSFEGLSGGQKRKVRLACAMALQDLVASRATKPIDLFIADEVDHALDEAGLERLMHLLDEKARERGTVLVISHNSLSDWIRDTALVTLKGGVSTVSGVLCE